MNRRTTAGAIGVIAAMSGVALTWPSAVVRFLRTCWPRPLWYVDTTEPLISLTFDDGPDPEYTPTVLDVLAKYNIKATFFLVGERARKYPGIMAVIRQRGHEIGNHTDSWRRTWLLGDREFETDLRRAEETLQIGSKVPRFFRPAGAFVRSSQIAIAGNSGYTCVLGSAYAFDPYRPPPAFISWLVNRAVRPGGIIVLHDAGGNRWNTVRALVPIIENANARGLRFVTLSELVAQSSRPSSSASNSQ